MGLFGNSSTRGLAAGDQVITPADLRPSPFSRDRQALFGAPMLADSAMTAPPVAPIDALGGFTGIAPAPAAPMQPSRPSFFGDGGAGRAIVGTIGDSLLTLSGGRPVYAPAMAEQRAARNAQLQQAAEWAHQASVKADDRAYEANKPQYFNAGNDRVMYDPTSGSSRTIYDAPEPFQTYASQFGDAGTPDYRTAAQDYVLRGNGPTAYGYDADLEGVRQGNRVALEGVRQGNRAALRGMPTYSDLHPRARGGGGGAGGVPRPPSTLAGAVAPILAKMGRGEQLTPGEQAAWQAYSNRGRGGGRGGKSPSGGGSSYSKVAVDGKGNKVGWNGSAWVPIR